eukprot:6381635-Amphidinium_carterae.1
MLHLYAGAAGHDSLHSAVMLRDVNIPVVEIDLTRGIHHDVLSNLPLQQAIRQHAEKGQIRAVLGGPNCRTWSRLRFSLPGPGPLRSRRPPTDWAGLSNLDASDQHKIFTDNALMQFFLDIASLVRDRGGFFVLEHPSDPGPPFPSIWACPKIKEWLEAQRAILHQFDACMYQPEEKALVRKPTTMACTLNIPELRLQCNHAGHRRRRIDSKSLARWPWGVMCILADTMVRVWHEGLPTPAAPPASVALPIHPDLVHEPPPQELRDILAGELVDRQGQEIIYAGSKFRLIRDGGGLPSMGHKRPSLRSPPMLLDLAEVLWKTLQTTPCPQAPPVVGQPPLQESTVHALRMAAARHLQMSQDNALHCPPGQPFFLKLFHAVALQAQDVDAHFLLDLLHPLPLGVEEQLPPTPGVFRTKSAAEATIGLHADFSSAQNYPSADKHEEDIMTSFEADVQNGLMAGPFATRQEVANFIGCREEEVIAGALAARVEGSKTRTIFDATITAVNDRIREHTPEKTEAPAVADVRHALALQHMVGQPVTGMKLDVSSAHRRIRICRKDWRYMTAQCRGQWFVNKVGTFGVASAQYHWGRVAALICRLCHHLSHGAWVFVYVDDFLTLHPDETAQRDQMIILAFLMVLNVPLSWRKLQHGKQLQWIGVHFDLVHWTVQPQGDKLPQLLGFLDSVVRGQPAHVKPLRHMLGVLAWYTGVLPQLKAFLAPLYKWLHAIKNAGRPSKLLRAIAQAFLIALQSPVPQPCEFFRLSSGRGATDAGASQHSATIGGWWSTSPEPQKDRVQWFSMELSPVQHAWAWKSGNPQHRIGAIELYANLVLLHMVSQTSDGSHLCWRVKSLTDNRSNAYGLHRWSLKAQPQSLLLIEIALLALRHNVYPAVEHIKRDHNTWADQLPHSDYSGFNLSSRWLVPEPFPFFLDWQTFSA